ncbi:MULTISPECIES: hypothetical protein [Methylomonas]|nr:MULTISPECIES: hypothetical protein [Methylomonas]BBL60599.1 hypothetical protein MKFW12EY_42120 [Methylomonas koyamae]
MKLTDADFKLLCCLVLIALILGWLNGSAIAAELTLHSNNVNREQTDAV